MQVAIPEKILMKDAIKYLVINQALDKRISEIKLEAMTSEKFNVFVREYIVAYAVDNKMPPAEIEGAIINIADDLLSGREITLKAGDYITLQNYMQKTNPKSLTKA